MTTMLTRILLLLVMATCQTALSAFTWSPSNQFSFLSGGANAHIGADADGNAMAVWSQFDGANNLINTSYFTAGAWGPTVTISSPFYSTDSVAETNVAMDASGTALAIWSSFSSAQTEVAVFNGSTWSAPVILDTTTAEQPEIAMDGSGKGIAGWTFTSVEVALYDGTTWGPVTLIPAVSPGAASVSISPNGTALVVWNEISTSTIYANFYNGSIWGPTTPISTGLFNVSPDVGMAADGTGIAVWDTGNDIVAALFDGANWSSPVIISSGIGNSFARIDVQADGKAVAVWLDSAGDIQAAIFAGSAWGAPSVISTGGGSTDPEVAMDGNGNAMAVWAVNNQIQSALLNSALGNVWSPQTLVATDAFFLDNPDVAFSQSGIAFAVWMNLSGEFTSDTFGSFTVVSVSVPPPTDFTGRTCKDHFAWQTDCVHILSWTPADSPIVVGYVLRRNGTVIAQIPATGPFVYQDHNRCKKTDVYSLSSIDATGQESVPVFVTLK